MGMRFPSAAVHGKNISFRIYLKGLSFIFQRHPEKCVLSLKKILNQLKGGNLWLVSCITLDSRQVKLSLQRSKKLLPCGEGVKFAPICPAPPQLVGMIMVSAIHVP